MLNIADDAKVDSDVVFNHSDRVTISVGAGSRIYRGSEFTGDVSIGADVFINRDCYVRPNTTIGDRVNIGPFVRLVTDTHDMGSHERRAGAVRHDAISVGDGSWIGASTTVLAGVTIGAGSVVAAGSVVTGDVPDDVVVAGVPAKIVKRLST
ncbi:acyltransferase [Microbacterium gubbeenense]|uniref:acyltransferase n=1 Tax=Microbacterium gubbeenense TaxID=159896 RepID=UPI003F9938FC